METRDKNSLDQVRPQKTEVKLILGNPPGWLVYSGNMIVLGAVIVVLTLSILIRYPDTLNAPVVITSESPATRIVANSSGRIFRLFVADQDQVEADDPLVLLENTAELKDVRLLETYIAKNAGERDTMPPPSPTTLRLGELQASYSEYMLAWNELERIIGEEVAFKRIRSREQQIRHLADLNKNLQKRDSIAYEEVRLQRTNFERMEGLSQAGAIPLVELEQAENTYLEARESRETIQSEIIQNRLTIERIRTGILEIEQGEFSEIATQRAVVREKRETVATALAEWKKKYLITAPFAGRISLTRYWNESQFVRSNEEILTLIPASEVDTDTDLIVGQASLPLKGSGKVKIGQLANIRLEAFPFQEYGVLKSRVNGISLVPEIINDQKMYRVDLRLEEGLTTSTGKTLPYLLEMQGQAVIVTEKRSLWERVMEDLLAVFRNE